ncbi:MAG: PucR family transcriptional regulator ligand-binding domain-containing protein [Christensenellaceae bacterium]|jgi:sugar diacid utilization regulator|nr:PucR family transcriptional regulator ligand-binding domain-containing protein [Christensenellaceae bacterium]
MNLTVESILGTGGLTDARIIAGERGLSNSVSSISVLEVGEAAIGRWVVQNQVYVTALYAIRNDVDMQKVVINVLANCGCSALIICHLGHWIPEVSAEVVNLCNTLNLPLIIANPEVSYASIIEPILKSLMLGTDNQQTGNCIQIRNDILELSVHESDSVSVLQKISQQTGINSTYLDIYYECIYSDKPYSAVEEEINYIRENISKIRHNTINNLYYIWRTDTGNKVIALVKTMQSFFGYLILDFKDGHDSSDEKLISELVSSLVVICTMMLSRKDRLDELQERYQNEYVADLLAWNFPSEDVAITRGAEVGLNIGNKHEVMAITIRPDPKSMVESILNVRSHIRETYFPLVNELVHYHDSNASLICRGDTIIVFFENTNSLLNLKQLGNAIEHLFNKERQLSVFAGISDSVQSIRELGTAYKQAINAAALGRSFLSDSHVTTWPEMWLLNNLQCLAEDQHAKTMFEQWIAPLAKHDKQYDGCLVETLSVLIACNLDMVKASRELYIHRNTLIYRKHKIVDILGYSPFELPYLFNFFVALQISSAPMDGIPTQ